jgi:hypothetical protein
MQSALVPTVPLRRITHLHVESESRDCDGRHSGGAVFTPNDGETGQELFTWWVRHELQFMAPVGALIERGTHQDGQPYLDVRESTEEGWRSTHVTGCDSTVCRLDYYRRRDHTAEAAGY